MTFPKLYRRRLFRKRFDHDSTLAQAIASSVCVGVPRLSLFSIWGIGRKSHPDSWDYKAMDFLQLVLDHLADFYSARINFSLVIADTHAELNGIPDDSRLCYQNAIDQLAGLRGWKYELLSNIVPPLPPQHEPVEFFELKSLPCLETLMESAKKHYHAGEPEQGVQRYVAERHYENPFLEKYFAGSILVSSSDWRLAALQPKLPCFWVWSIQRGMGHKPWFITEADSCVA